MAFLIQTLAGASVGASGGYSAAKSGESLSAKSSNCSAASIVDASNSESGVFQAAKKASVLLLVTSIIVVPLALPYVDVIHNYPLLFATTFIGAFMCMFVFVYICNHKTTGTLASKRNFFSIRSLNTEYSRRNLRNCFTRTLDIRGPYNVCLDNTSYHWILLFKPMDRRLNWLPILSIEITTDDEHKSIIPVMKKYKELPTPVCYKGSVEISMCELCAIGDRVLSKMESYELTTRNCQTFCNAILVELGLTPERTTVETVKSAAKIGGVVVTAAAVASMCTVM
eukprot:Em0001g3631a